MYDEKIKQWLNKVIDGTKAFKIIFKSSLVDNMMNKDLFLNLDSVA